MHAQRLDVRARTGTGRNHPCALIVMWIRRHIARIKVTSAEPVQSHSHLEIIRESSCQAVSGSGLQGLGQRDRHCVQDRIMADRKVRYVRQISVAVARQDFPRAVPVIQPIIYRDTLPANSGNSQ